MRTFDPKRRYTGLFIPNCLAESELFSLAQKFIWGRLVQYANDEGVAWPKVETLARDCAMSRRTVLRVIAELEGVLLEVERPDGIHRLSHRSNRYRFLYHSVFEEADATGCQFVTSGGVAYVTSGGVQDVTSTEEGAENKEGYPTGKAPMAPAGNPPFPEESAHWYRYSPGDSLLAMDLYEMLHKVFPPDSPPKTPHTPTWVTSIRLMRTNDKRTHAQIRALWHWVIHHKYWAGKIISPGGLRKRWDSLILERQNDDPGSTIPTQTEGDPHGKYNDVGKIIA